MLIVLDHFRNAKSTPRCLLAQFRRRLSFAFFNVLIIQLHHVNHQSQPHEFLLSY
jgi:hypothetical protein